MWNGVSGISGTCALQSHADNKKGNARVAAHKASMDRDGTNRHCCQLETASMMK